MFCLLHVFRRAKTVETSGKWRLRAVVRTEKMEIRCEHSSCSQQWCIFSRVTQSCDPVNSTEKSFKSESFYCHFDHV